MPLPIIVGRSTKTPADGAGRPVPRALERPGREVHDRGGAVERRLGGRRVVDGHAVRARLRVDDRVLRVDRLRPVLLLGDARPVVEVDPHVEVEQAQVGARAPVAGRDLPRTRESLAHVPNTTSSSCSVLGGSLITLWQVHCATSRHAVERGLDRESSALPPAAVRVAPHGEPAAAARSSVFVNERFSSFTRIAKFVPALIRLRGVGAADAALRRERRRDVEQRRLRAPAWRARWSSAGRAAGPDETSA